MTYLQEIEVAKHQSERIYHERKAYQETEKCRLLSHSTPVVAPPPSLAAQAQTASARRQHTEVALISDSPSYQCAIED